MTVCRSGCHRAGQNNRQEHFCNGPSSALPASALSAFCVAGLISGFLICVAKYHFTQFIIFLLTGRRCNFILTLMFSLLTRLFFKQLLRNGKMAVRRRGGIFRNAQTGVIVLHLFHNSFNNKGAFLLHFHPCSVRPKRYQRHYSSYLRASFALILVFT